MNRRPDPVVTDLDPGHRVDVTEPALKRTRPGQRLPRLLFPDPRTIRHYEESGLVVSSARSQDGFRRSTEADVAP
ncbi:hypothetical protein ACWD00_40780 [Streptomyces viridiviolaceus]